MTDAAGAAAAMDETLGSTTSATLSSFTKGLQTAFVDMLGGQVIPALTSGWEWLQRNRNTIQTVATVVGVVLLPLLAAWGIASTVNAAMTSPRGSRPRPRRRGRRRRKGARPRRSPSGGCSWGRKHC